MRASILAACVALASCGGGMNPSSQYAAPADFLTAQEIASCQRQARCGFIGASEEKQCELDAAAYAKNYPQPYTVGEAVTSKRLKYDPAEAKKCIDALSVEGCTTDLAFKAQASCTGVFTAQVMVGGSCRDDGECVGGFC